MISEQSNIEQIPLLASVEKSLSLRISFLRCIVVLTSFTTGALFYSWWTSHSLGFLLAAVCELIDFVSFVVNLIYEHRMKNKAGDEAQVTRFETNGAWQSMIAMCIVGVVFVGIAVVQLDCAGGLQWMHFERACIFNNDLEPKPHLSLKIVPVLVLFYVTTLGYCYRMGMFDASLSNSSLNTFSALVHVFVSIIQVLIIATGAVVMLHFPQDRLLIDALQCSVLAILQIVFCGAMYGWIHERENRKSEFTGADRAAGVP